MGDRIFRVYGSPEPKEPVSFIDEKKAIGYALHIFENGTADRVRVIQNEILLELDEGDRSE